MALTAGELREKLAFSRVYARIPNGSGGFETLYATLLNTFAKVVEENSNPQLIAGQENIVNYVHFVIRYRADNPIRIADRMMWRNNFFTVNNIKVDPLRTQIDIYCNSEIETSER